MSGRILLGVETEYGIYGLQGGAVADLESLARDVINAARRALPTLSDGSTCGCFLPNGGRLYLDAGCHPELATPECPDPWEALAHIRAGEALLDRMARALVDEGDYASVIVLRSNVDYGGETWGSHESYLMRSYDIPSLSAQLIPHLVSRVIYTGAGGFDPRGRFTLSPRAGHLTSVVSHASLSDRPLLHIKDEPHADGGYHRLHLICGETLCSDTGTVLRLGTTALIVTLIDLGFDLGAGVTPEEPVAAIRTIAADPTLRATVPLAEGGRMTALAIQRRYLRRVREVVQQGLLPRWAPGLCDLWEGTLDALARGPGTMARTLDWAIKRVLLIRRPGVRPAASTWGSRCQADLHFSQLGATGIFDELDRAGVLDHAQPRPYGAQDPMRTGPSGGRGRLRGHWVRRLAADPDRSFGAAALERYACGWDAIEDRVGHTMLRLLDVWSESAQWHPCPPPPVMVEVAPQGTG